MAGPYAANRITAATFAFRRELLDTCRYSDTDCISEESIFLQNYSISVIPLDPIKTILVCSHTYNTIDKDGLLEQTADLKTNPYLHLTNLTLSDFIQDDYLYECYSSRIFTDLYQYDPGSLTYKPDVLLELKDRQIIKLQKMLTSANIENDRLQKLSTHMKDILLKKITNK